jgi:homocysteine S-methyltransferase
MTMPMRHRAKYRTGLPQLDGGMFLTDGGLETSLIFHEGWELPMFEAFALLETERGQAALRAYYDRYALLAVERGVGFVLESPTWRANPDWAARLGYARDKLAELNRAGVDLMHEIRARYETDDTPIVISGCIGPRGDGYDPGSLMSAAEAESTTPGRRSCFATAAATASRPLP